MSNSILNFNLNSNPEGIHLYFNIAELVSPNKL